MEVVRKSFMLAGVIESIPGDDHLFHHQPRLRNMFPIPYEMVLGGPAPNHDVFREYVPPVSGTAGDYQTRIDRFVQPTMMIEEEKKEESTENLPDQLSQHMMQNAKFVTPVHSTPTRPTEHPRTPTPFHHGPGELNLKRQNPEPSLIITVKKPKV